MSEQATIDILKFHCARHPELADTLGLHIAILEARAAVTATAPPLLADDARARLARGVPVLRADELTLDWDALARLIQTLCAIAARHRPDQADAFTEIAREMSPSRAEELARAFLANTFASRVMDHSPLDAFVLNNALRPFLSAYARGLGNFVNDAAWYRADCPICGGAPDFAALEKESGARRLLCARCDAEWTFHRAVCPFCSEESPGKIGYHPSADGAYRLYTCENCKRYLKTIDLRELAREVNLAAERILTIGMDVAARKAGYRGV